MKDVLIASNDFLLSGAKSSSFGASSGGSGHKKQENESMVIPKLVMYCLTKHLRGDPDLDKDDVSIMILDFKWLVISRISH